MKKNNQAFLFNILVRNHAHGRFVFYPARCDWHGDFMRPKCIVKYKSYITLVKLHWNCSICGMIYMLWIIFLHCCNHHHIAEINIHVADTDLETVNFIIRWVIKDPAHKIDWVWMLHENNITLGLYWRSHVGLVGMGQRRGGGAG